MIDESVELVSHDGSRHLIDRAAVIGRAPDRGGMLNVAIDDRERALSKNHVLVRPFRQSLEVTDLGSTNGTAAVFDGVRIDLAAGQPTHVTLPCVLDCGGVSLSLTSTTARQM